MATKLILVKNEDETRAVLSKLGSQGLRWVSGRPASDYLPPFEFGRGNFERFIVVNDFSEFPKYKNAVLQFAHTRKGREGVVVTAAEFLRERLTIHQMINLKSFAFVRHFSPKKNRAAAARVLERSGSQTLQKIISYPCVR